MLSIPKYIPNNLQFDDIVINQWCKIYILHLIYVVTLRMQSFVIETNASSYDQLSFVNNKYTIFFSTQTKNLWK